VGWGRVEIYASGKKEARKGRVGRPEKTKE
jgi:hypothetical protein